jgi:glycosyltransferase involved in cell wall biosynthesis
MSEKRVLIFTQSAVGGAERISALIGNQLMLEGYSVVFCLVGQHNGTSILDFIEKSAEKISISFSKFFPLIWGIYKTILHVKPDFVFSSVININNKVLLLKPFFRRKKFIIRCDTNVTVYSDKQRTLISRIYPLADCIIAQTEEMKEGLINITGLSSSKVVVLHNPVDKVNITRLVSERTPFTSERRHIVAVGRFAPPKGYETLIDSFVELAKKREDVELCIVGDYKPDNTIYRYVVGVAERNGISSRVNCVGYQSNPYKYLVNADCFVLSSRWEGLPNVLIESLYLGTPVAAVKCVPIVERIVENGVNGVLVEKGDVRGLANAMEEAMKLGRIKSSYKPSNIADFIALFT